MNVNSIVHALTLTSFKLKTSNIRNNTQRTDFNEYYRAVQRRSNESLNVEY